MLKIYGIHGRTQAIIKFPLNDGKAWHECEFKHGRIGAGLGNRPATYPTSDETEQNIIEDSRLFKENLVFLHRIAGDDGKPTPETPAPAPVQEPEYVSGVTSREEAIEYLKAHGAKAVNLKDDAAIKKFMAKINVAFPNFEF